MNKLIVVVFLVITTTITTTMAYSDYPEIKYLSVNNSLIREYNHIIYSFNETYFKDINIIVYGKEMWYEQGFYIPYINTILIDELDFDLFKYVLKHELTHHKCWKLNYDLSHDSKCFKDGLR